MVLIFCGLDPENVEQIDFSGAGNPEPVLNMLFKKTLASALKIDGYSPPMALTSWLTSQPVSLSLCCVLSVSILAETTH